MRTPIPVDRPFDLAKDAAIRRGIADDPGTMALTDEQMAELRPLKTRGRPRLARPKERLTTRADGDVLDAIKASREGWQTRVNDALREAVKRGKFGAWVSSEHVCRGAGAARPRPWRWSSIFSGHGRSSAPGTMPAVQRSHPTMTPRQLVEQWVQAFNRADADALAVFYTDDAVNHQVAESPVQGRAAIRRMFAEGFAAATMVCIVEQIFEDGEWAILEWRDPLGLRGCGFFHVVDGRIVFQRGYWDKLSFLRQQGLPLPRD